MLDGSVDVAVHSLKDLPTQGPEELILAAVPPREDVADALIAPSSDSGGSSPGQRVWAPARYGGGLNCSIFGPT